MEDIIKFIILPNRGPREVSLDGEEGGERRASDRSFVAHSERLRHTKGKLRALLIGNNNGKAFLSRLLSAWTLDSGLG